MRIRSLSGRLGLLQQAVAGGVIALLAVSTLWLTGRTLEREDRSRVASTAERLAENLDREYQEEGDLPAAARAVVEEEPVSDLRVTIRDTSGNLLAARGPVTGTEPARGEDRGVRASTTSTCGGVVQVSVSSAPRESAVAALARAVLLSAVPILLLTLWVGRAVSRRALRPLDEMGRRAREAVAEAPVRTLGPPSGVAEVDGLQTSFERLLAQLADVLESERRFTADASHELRTPLTVLAGELELMLSRHDLPDEARAGATRAAEQARAMGELIDALLLLRLADSGPRAEPGAFVPVNVADVAREVVEEALSREPSRAPDVECAAPDEALASGDEVLLRAGLRNVVGNALKFTEPGQRVRVQVEGGREISVTVDDGGTGVPSAERERVFDLFFRGAETRARRGGFGLGLPLLRRVARAHGGDAVLAESPLGGARVVLTVPAWRGPGPGDRPPGPPASLPG